MSLRGAIGPAFLTVVLGAASLALSACARDVTVGVIISRSGGAAFYGERVQKGLDLAAEEINADAGPFDRRVRLAVRDDATLAERGVQALESLANQEGAHLVVGAVSSSVTLAVARVCERRHIVLISPTASAPEVSDAGEYVFRIYPSETLEGRSMADFARDVGLARVAIAFEENEYGRGLADVFAEQFERGGRRIVGRAPLREGEADSFDAAARLAASEHPDGVYVAAYQADTADLMRRLRALRYGGVVIGTSSINPETVRSAGKAGNGLVFPHSAFDAASPDPRVRRFVAAFRAKFGETPDTWAAHGYDALMVLWRAVARAGSADAGAVREALATTDDFSGATGRIAFDPKGDVLRYPRLFVVHDDTVQPYDRFVETGGVLPVPGR